MAERTSKASIEAETSNSGVTMRTEDSDLAPEERQSRIAETAYFIAAARDFVGGDPVQDWCEAEIMVNAALLEELKR